MFKTNIRRIGGSLVIYIPSYFVKQEEFVFGQEITVSINEKPLTIVSEKSEQVKNDIITLSNGKTVSIEEIEEVFVTNVDYAEHLEEERPFEMPNKEEILTNLKEAVAQVKPTKQERKAVEFKERRFENEGEAVEGEEITIVPLPGKEEAFGEAEAVDDSEPVYNLNKTNTQPMFKDYKKMPKGKKPMGLFSFCPVHNSYYKTCGCKIPQ
jgi:antitoxin component of MazEF toxin-antitoxin module